MQSSPFTACLYKPCDHRPSDTLSKSDWKSRLLSSFTERRLESTNQGFRKTALSASRDLPIPKSKSAKRNLINLENWAIQISELKKGIKCRIESPQRPSGTIDSFPILSKPLPAVEFTHQWLALAKSLHKFISMPEQPENSCRYCDPHTDVALRYLKAAMCVQNVDDQCICNSQCFTQLAAFFIDLRTEWSIVQNCISWFLRTYNT
jgi:hypothetical protein